MRQHAVADEDAQASGIEKRLVDAGQAREHCPTLGRACLTRINALIAIVLLGL
jgi:hypothetical protein